MSPGPEQSAWHAEKLKMSALKRFLKNEDGVTAIEYGLIAALIGVAIIVAVGTVGSNLNGTFDKVAQKLG
jgi:pilus assembly protein Flp/PilA